MSLPLIGVTTYNTKNKNEYPIAAVMHKYIAAIHNAGGAVVLIPSGLTEQAIGSIMKKLDGILFTGGGDVDPSFYTSEHQPVVKDVDYERDITEITLARAIVLTGKPFLGICRGFQLLNVAFGGTLFSHLPSQYPNAIKHDYDSGTQRELLAHDIILEPDSHVLEITDKNKLQVNSLHHQGVKQLARDFRAVGYAPDGLLEAIELPGYRFGIAVQWHPEWLTQDPAARRLFLTFIEAARAESLSSTLEKE